MTIPAAVLGVWYHYCCRHSARKITNEGFLRPMCGAAYGGIDLIWLTDQQEPDREGLGLTSHLIRCDRLAYQYIVLVDPGLVEPWIGSAIRNAISFTADIRVFERAPGRQPATWFIATRPVWAIRNRAYRGPAA